jgi:phosphatidate cytidylyltransferase
MPLDSASDASVRSPTTRPPPSNLIQRLVSAAVLLPLVVLIVWLGGLWVDAVVVAATLLILNELYQIFEHTGQRPRTIGYICATLLIAAASLRTRVSFDFTGLALLTTIIAPLVGEFPRRQREGSLLSWTLTTSGAIYIGWTMAHFVLLRQLNSPLHGGPLAMLRLDAGAAWIMFGLLITFAGDTMAYIVGRALGRHRMAPYISPKKSWEGALGGLVGAMVCGMLLVPLLGLPISVAGGALLGGVGSAAGQAGDLAESLIKRQVGVKDSGRLIPGHGGILDRADSLLFTIPTLYYVVIWLTGP